MKKNIITLLIAIVSISVFSQDINTFFTKTDAFLTKYVNNGRVAYDKINSNQSELNELTKLSQNISVAVSDAKNYQAFWINAYNLHVIKGIIDNYPTKSPLDNAGFFDKTKYNIAGKSITLNDIENKLLREQFKDARFHFVLVCGAVGCPPLINKAYLPNTLDAQMDKQTKLALNGDYFIKVNTKKKRIQGSQILEWYKGDFTTNGNEIDYINKYRTEKIPNNFKLSYFTYDWNLNKQ